MKKNDDNNTILVVDDSDIIRHSLKNFFEDYEFEVVTSTDGLDGIKKAVDYKPAVIFLDLMMPNINGVKMLQVIKVLDHIKDIPVIVISGNTNRTNVLASIEAGAERVISKPLHKDIIIKNLNELLGADFLERARKKNMPQTPETSDIKKQLCGFFLKSYPRKRDTIAKALETSNAEMLRSVVHEIRGAGGAIGYPELTTVSGNVENHLDGGIVDWTHVRKMCSEIFSIVDKIEENYSLAEN